MVKNETGACVKVKNMADIMLIPCPEDKERNPKTGRCVAKCKPGYTRDADFKCIKIRQPRIVIDKATVACPEGKERNPKTRRCVAKCKPGYMRDGEFKCVKNRTQKLVE
jgi:hypothetical protein